MEQDYKKTKIIFFLFLIVGMRFIWFFHYKPNTMLVSNGSVSFGSDETSSINLDGEWQFIANKWVLPSDHKKIKSEIIHVPQKWNYQFKKKKSDYHKGTYYLTINLPSEEMNLALYTGNIKGLSQIYVDEDQVYSYRNDKQKKTEYSPQIISINKEPGVEKITLVVQVMSSAYRSGGIVRSMKLGHFDVIERRTTLNRNIEVFTSTILFIIGLFSLMLFFLSKIKTDYLYFSGIFVSLSILFLLSTGEKMLIHYLTFSPEFKLKFEMLLVLTVGMSLLALVQRTKKELENTQIQLLQKIFLGFGMILMLLSIQHFLRCYDVFLWLFLVVLLMSIWSVRQLSMINNHSKSALFYALLLMINHLIWWFYVVQHYYALPHYPLDILLSVVFVLVAWVKNYEHMYLKLEKLTQELSDMNHMRDVFLMRASKSIVTPLHSMGILIDSMQNEQKEVSSDAIDLQDELSLLRKINREATNLVENLIGTTTSNNQIESLVDLRTMTVIDKVEYVTSVVQYEEQYTHITPILNMHESNNYILGDPQKFIQLLFQFYGIARKIPGTQKIYFDNKESNGYIKFEVLLVNSEMDDKQYEFVKMILDNPNLAMSLFDYDYGVEIRLIQTLVHLQEGHLKVKRKASGLCFIVCLKRSNPEEVDSYYAKKLKLLEEEVSQTIDDQQRILVLTHDSSKCLILKKALSNKGYSVKTISSSKDILKVIETYKPSLLIMDVVLTKVNGFILTKQIRKQYDQLELPIILILSNSYEIEVKKVYKSGANDYLDFPLDYSALIEKTRNILYTKAAVEDSLAYEISWLQAQIEPHFLFNTLNTIVGLSTYDEDKMYRVLDAFIELLHAKYHLSNPNQLITLEQELHLVQAYCQIEEIRFENRVKITFEIGEQLDLRKVKIPPLVLQPLVENAIRHGVLPLNENGHVIITVEEQGQDILLKISDNGVGTDRPFIDILNDEYETSGIGLVNTYQRIKKMLDADFVWTSERNVGTDILIFLKGEDRHGKGHDH